MIMVIIYLGGFPIYVKYPEGTATCAPKFCRSCLRPTISLALTGGESLGNIFGEGRQETQKLNDFG
jgi:hypothetical protein